MKKISEMFEAMDLGRLFEVRQGECPEHGPSESVVRRKDGIWRCMPCQDVKHAQESAAQLLRERVADLKASAKLPPRFVGQRFVASSPAQKVVRTQVKMFRDFIVSERSWAALLLVGETGTGKTLLACEVAEALMENLAMSVHYVTAKGLISEIQATYGREGKSEEEEIDRFARYDLLMIDEIDVKPDRENANLLLNEVISRRYNANKPVVAITNQPIATLARHIGDRAFSRLNENAFIGAFTWADQRRAA